MVNASRHDEAINELEKLYELYPLLKKNRDYAQILKEGATLAFSINHYKEAMRMFNAGYKVGEISGDKRTRIACYGNIGVVFAVMEDNGTAIHYLENAFDQAESEGYTDLAHIYANNLVVALCDIGDTERAEEYAIKNRILTNDTTPESHFRLIKDVFLISEARKDTRGMMNSAHDIFDYVMHNDMKPFYKTAAFEFMGNAYQQTCQYDSAIYYYEKSLDAIRGQNMYDLYLKKLKKLANVCSLSGNQHRYNDCQKEIDKLSDSIHNRKDEAAAKEMYWNLEEKARFSFIGELNNKISRQSTIIIIISSLLAIMMTLLGIIICLLRKKHTMYQALYERSIETYSVLPDTPETSDGHCTINPDDGNPIANNISHDLSEQRQQKLLNDIVKTMNNIEIFTNPDFSLNMLTKLVGSNVNYVSRVINSMLNKNFKTYINEQRIMEACRRLREQPDSYPTMSNLGESVGYKSESSFFQSFKKIVGMTPLEYRRISEKDIQKNIHIHSHS